MRVAIFTDTFTPQVNGVAKTLERLTRYFQKEKIAYSVFAPQHTAEDNFVANVNKMRSIPLTILYPECRFSFPTPRIKRELLSFKPDMIHIATPFNMGLCGLYYAKKLNIPVVGSYHTDFDAYLRYYKIEFLSNMLWNYLKWFHSHMQKNFVPSPETLHQLKHKGFQALSIWGRGVDCTLFHPAYNTDLFRKNIILQRSMSFPMLDGLPLKKILICCKTLSLNQRILKRYSLAYSRRRSTSNKSS